jgi:dUTP pyrophosphatase
MARRSGQAWLRWGIVRTSPTPSLSTPPAGVDQVEVLLHRLDSQLPVPSYAHPGDAGADLITSVDVTLAPGERQTVPTGVAIALPAGFAAFIHPRSGLAARSGLTIVNAPGTVDAGYRGEIQVTLLNTDSAESVQLRRGDRIAQLVVQRVSQVRFVEVERLPGSARGVGGFGSTGGFAGNEYSVRGNSARGQGEI